MPSNFPASNDDFSIPDAPLVTPLGESGTGNTRSHTQHHRDLGDAIEAIQAHVAITTHDHSGTGPRATPKLLQVNTHGSPDTNQSNSSLHHTLGSGAFQAAAGNHNHDGINSPNISIASVSNLQSTLDSKLNVVDYEPPVVADYMLVMALMGG